MISFTFPKNKTIFKGKLVDFYYHKGFKVSDIDMLNPQDNLITIKNVDYYFTYLSPTGRNKGGNSIILKLYESQNFDLEDIEYGDPDLILKILKFKKSENELFQKKSERRFLKEIDALKKCKLEKFLDIQD